MAIEVIGIICLGLAIALLWLRRPLNGAKASFLDSPEIPYALLVVFLLAGGVGGMILGITG